MNLLSLLGLGSAGASQAAQAPPTIGTEEIVATGQRPQAPTPNQSLGMDDLLGRGLGNVDIIQERDQALRNGQGAAEHKGMFGMKGTLRDVLGLLGDAMLVQSGNKATYSGVRQQEKYGDAMAGYTVDPQAAAERGMGVDPTAASKFRQDTEENQYRQGSLQSQQANRESLINDRQFGNEKDAVTNLRALFASPQAQKNPDLAMKQAERIATMAGKPLDYFGITPGMTDVERQMYGAAGMNPYQQGQLPIAQQNANSKQFSAHKAPAGRNPPNPTDTTLAQGLLDKVGRGETLTKGEQEKLDRLKPMPTQKGSRQRPSQAAPAPGSARKFKRLN